MKHENAAILVTAAIGRRLDGEPVAQFIRSWFASNPQRSKIESTAQGPSGDAAVNDLEAKVSSWAAANVQAGAKFTLADAEACVAELSALETWLCSDD